MGYRSDVRVAVSFDNEHTRKEVMAVYSMHPSVQEHNIAKDWHVHDGEMSFWRDNTGGSMPVYTLMYSADYVKWYDTYEDVQAVEFMHQICAKFDAEREAFSYAYKFIRVGEEIEDIEIRSDHGNDDVSSDLDEYLSDMLGVRVEIVSAFD